MPAVLLLLALATGCGTEPHEVAAAAPDGDAAQGAADAIALVQTEPGLAGVPVGSSEPAWVRPGAVAAPDGSAVFDLELAQDDGGSALLVAVDPFTGVAREGGVQLDARDGLAVGAVEPGGERVALIAPDAIGTLVLDVDIVHSTVVHSTAFEGTVVPEAYSVDRSLLFAERSFGDLYHVHALELATGEQWATLGRDKSKPPEDMYGSIEQAVLSPDRTQLATLYRDTETPGHTAFVHLLSLSNGTTVCIDLHEPFGTGAPGTDAIEWRTGGVVVAGHSPAAPAQSVVATFEPAQIWEGTVQEHYHAEVHAELAPPSVPDGVVDAPGFRRFVAVAVGAPTVDS